MGYNEDTLQTNVGTKTVTIGGTAMDYLIGLDIGTSSVKGVLLATDGNVRFAGKESFVYTYPCEKGVEISAEAYLQTCCRLLRRLTAELPTEGTLRGVCAAAASGNLLLLDKDGKPSTPIYNWQDHRVSDECTAVLGADFDREAYYRKIGWGFLPHSFPLAMLCWLKVHKPELLAEAGKVCMSTEYLFHSLTGNWGISNSAGTPFYLIDQRQDAYIPEVLNALGIKEDQLPPVSTAGELLGYVTPEGTALSGLPTGTAVYLGTFDHPSAARAAGILHQGQLLLSCGTSWVCFYPLRERSAAIDAHMLVDPFLSDFGGCWAGMASLSSISVRIERYIRRYIADTGNIFDVFAEEAAKSAPGAGGLVLDLYSDTEITGYPKCHIARAVMEAVVRLLQDQLAQMESHGIAVKEAVMVGGPSECPLWGQVIEEMTGLRVLPGKGAYTGAEGAAILAGIGAGIWKNEQEALR